MKKSLYDDHNLLLAALLKEKRKQQNISQSVLAQKLDHYRTFVSKYETGERRLDIVEIRSVCEALEMDFIEFMILYDKECKDLPRSLIRDQELRKRL